jgi:gluconate transporter
MTNLSYPIFGLVLAVFVLVLLVLRTKVHPLIAMIIASCIAGITGGMSADETLNAITKGFGTTLGSIGIIIGLGVMMGRILEVSGAAEQIAYSFIKWLGKRKEEWALAITGYFVSIPIFADSAFVILYPIAKALAKKGNRSILTMGVALAGGLVVTHTTIPPTPGPLAVAGLFGVDVGAMMLLGITIAIPCAISFVLYGKWLGSQYPNFQADEIGNESLEEVQKSYLEQMTHRKLPTLLLSIVPILVPILLIFFKALINIFPELLKLESVVLKHTVQVFYFIGNPIIALCISTLLAVYTLVPFLNKHETSKRLEEGLLSAGIILMVTGAGGALGFVVRESGAGAELAVQMAYLPFSPIMIPFLIATAIRLIQGSGTVAMITAASITAPILEFTPNVNMLFAAQATVLGSFFFSYFNDSLFWVVNRMMGIEDVKQQLMTWSVPTTIAWAIGGIFISTINLVFGTGGSLLDPLIPFGGLLLLYLVLKLRPISY